MTIGGLSMISYLFYGYIADRNYYPLNDETNLCVDACSGFYTYDLFL